MLRMYVKKGDKKFPKNVVMSSGTNIIDFLNKGGNTTITATKSNARRLNSSSVP